MAKEKVAEKKKREKDVSKDAAVIRKSDDPLTEDTPVVQGTGFDYYRSNKLLLAVELREATEVEQDDGYIYEAEAGDYVAVGEDGHPYIIKRAEFLAEYVPVPPAKRDTQAVGSE